jgi:hypothetical protein
VYFSISANGHFRKLIMINSVLNLQVNLFSGEAWLYFSRHRVKKQHWSIVAHEVPLHVVEAVLKKPLSIRSCVLCGYS